MKKAFLFLIFALLQTSVGQFLPMAQATIICPVKDNKKAAYTFTADDGFTNAAEFFNKEFKRLTLCGSLALVANWINGTQSPASTTSYWNSLLSEGRFDVVNHSKTHIKFSTISTSQTGKDSLYNEIAGNQSVFRRYFPGQHIITMANPSVVNTLDADSIIRKTHYAARNGGSGYNSLSPSETEWFKLNMLANYFSSQKRAAYSHELNKYVENVLNAKKWLIILAHGIGTGANAMTDTAFSNHFEFVASKRNDLWICTFGDATRYFREKQHASISTIDSTFTGMSLSLTHDLDASIFTHPLTLKTLLPDGWDTVQITQGTQSRTGRRILEDGKSYLYYDAVPNAGIIHLRPIGISQQTPQKRNDNFEGVVYQSETRTLQLPNSKNIVALFNSKGLNCGTFLLHGTSISLQLDDLSHGLYFVRQCSYDGKIAVSKILVN